MCEVWRGWQRALGRGAADCIAGEPLSPYVRQSIVSRGTQSRLLVQFSRKHLVERPTAPTTLAIAPRFEFHPVAARTRPWVERRLTIVYLERIRSLDDANVVTH